MEDAKLESKNPKNELNPYGCFRGALPQRVCLFG